MEIAEIDEQEPEEIEKKKRKGKEEDLKDEVASPLIEERLVRTSRNISPASERLKEKLILKVAASLRAERRASGAGRAYAFAESGLCRFDFRP